MADICTDNRFELIEKYKMELIESTNIESAQDEMAVLDDLLFRFWQMGWLDRLEQPERRWIPCSERLPEEYGEYLITWETSKAPTRFIGFAEGEETGVWDDQHDRFVFSWLPEDYIIERYPDWRVIAWLPLPEPYKGEQE